jgi:hypothetical protein
MTQGNTRALNESIKLELLRRIFIDQSPRDILQQLGAEEIVSSFRFIWEKTIEFGIHARGITFSQDELISHCQSNAEPLPEACRSKPHPCYSLECILHQRDCAIPRISDQIDRLCETARVFLQQLKS